MKNMEHTDDQKALMFGDVFAYFPSFQIYFRDKMSEDYEIWVKILSNMPDISRGISAPREV